MGLEESLRVAIEAEMTRTGENLTRFCERLNVPPSSIGRFLRSERSLKTPTILTIADTLGLRLTHPDPVGVAAGWAREQRQRFRMMAEEQRQMAGVLDRMSRDLDDFAESRHRAEE